MITRRRSLATLSTTAAALVSLGLLAGRAEGQSAAANAKPVFRAGAATANITPFLGEPIVGNFETPPANHVHDELQARCLVLDDGATRLAIVLVDSVGVSREVFDAARRIAAEKAGIPGPNILAAATHTHSGTSSRSENMMRANATLAPYQQLLAQRIADVIRIAANNLEPAQIGWGAVDVPGPLFNRRWLLKPGKKARNPFGGEDLAVMNPGKNPDILEPAGPTDPQVSFLAVRTPQGRPIALLANYSLHYVGGVPMGHISADYFACFAARIGELLGADARTFPPFVGVMSNGTSGDVNNIDVKAASTPAYAPYQKMSLVANEVAEAVAGAYRNIAFRDHVPLAAADRELILATRKPTPEQVEYARKILAKSADAPRYHGLERAYAERTLEMTDAPAEISARLQALRIGDLGVAAIPFEVFTEAGLEIKKRSPFKSTFTIELAGGSYGYLPTPRHFAIGGYETWLGTNNVEPEAAPKIVNALMELFADLDARRKSESSSVETPK
jgi:neutral ceramidase